MRRIIVDIYKIIYKITKNKLASLSFALVYISLLEVITLYGLCQLLSGWEPMLEGILPVFRVPYVFGVFLAFVGINFWMMLPLQNLSKEKSNPSAMGPIIIFSLVAFVLFFYTQYADRIF